MARQPRNDVVGSKVKPPPPPPPKPIDHEFIKKHGLPVPMPSRGYS